MIAIRAILIFIIILSIAGCSSSQLGNKEKTVLTTTFHIYSITKTIVGDTQGGVKVQNLLPSGVDIHDFTLSPEMAKDITKADVIFINGANLENAIIKDLVTNNKNVIEVSQEINYIYDKDDNEHRFPNPHLWIDPVNGKKQASVILNELISLDPKHKAQYETNAAKLNDEFDDIIKLYRSLELKKHRYLSIHNAFIYLQPYGYEQVMALDPGNTHTLSPQTVIDADNLLAKPDTILVGEINVTYKPLEGMIKKYGAKYIALDTIEVGTENESYTEKLKQNYEKLKLLK